MNPPRSSYAWPTPATHEVVRALAGAGKTHLLSIRYLRLLRRGALPRTILATTFTRKAAGEILERVLTMLAQAAQHEDDAHRLAEAIGDPALDRKGFQHMLTQVCDSLHRVTIGTIDSFFNRIGQTFHLELGLPRHVRLVGGDDPLAARIRSEAVQSTLEAASQSEETRRTLASLLRRLQHDSAKRTVSEAIDQVIRQLYELYKEAPDPNCWSSLPVPGTRLDEAALNQCLDALTDLASVIPRTKKGTPNQKWHKAHAKILATLVTRDWHGFLSCRLVSSIDNGQPTFSRVEIPESWIEALKPLIDHVKCDMVWHVREQTEATHELLHEFDAHYQRIHHDQGVLLYADLTNRLSRQWQQLGEEMWGHLYFRLDAHVQHLLLDEFQDTSRQQWEVLRPIAGEIASHHDGSRSLFCVGDVKQAIYGWRGGCTEIFEGIEDELHLPASARQKLSKSWRSSQVVLNVVDRVFGRLEQNPVMQHHASVVEAWQQAMEQHQAQRNRKGYAVLVSLPVTSRPASSEDDSGGSEEEVTGHLAADYETEAAARIADLHHQTPTHTIGVLTRDNRCVRVLIDLLHQKQVPASGEGGNPLIDDAAVNTILAALTMADHPGHTIAAFQVCHSPLGPVLELGSMTAPERDRVARKIRRDLALRGYGKVLAEWVRRLDPVCSTRNRLRLWQLVELAETYDASPTLRPHDFTSFVKRTPVEEPSASPVRVMTIHKAKGLEFDIVVLPQLNKQLAAMYGNPAYVVRDNPTGPVQAVYRSAPTIVRALSPALSAAHDDEVGKQLHDDLCALYVAMTRPRHALHMYVEPIRFNKDRQPGRRGLHDLSYAAILRHALTDVNTQWSDGALFERGNPLWHEQEPGPLSPPPTPRPEVIEPIVFASTAHQPRRSWRRLTPSTTESGGQVQAADLLTLEDTLPRRSGTMLHAWFEKIVWLDGPDSLPNERTLRETAHLVDPGLEENSLTRLIAEFKSAVHRPSIADALCRPVDGALELSTKLWRERSFAVRVETELITGKFDRVVIRERAGIAQQADILDFKTDRTAGDRLASLIEKYRPQMQTYRAALATILHLAPDKITATLLFTNSGDACTV